VTYFIFLGILMCTNFSYNIYLPL